MRVSRYAAAVAAVALTFGASLSLQLDALGSGIQTPSPPSAATAAISGSVVSAATGDAIARARVSLTSAALSSPRAVITDSAGAFHFRALPPGTYGLSVTRTGYAPQRLGLDGDGALTRIQLDAAQQITGVTIPLSPAGVIVGRLLDEDGAPLAGATVEAQARRNADGRQMLVTVTSTQTDDRGMFRLSGLSAGQHYVRALDPVFANASDERGLLRYAPTYHPGVVMPQDAKPIGVTPGKETAPIEFRLQFTRPASVSGRMATIDGRRLLTGAVMLVGAGSAPYPSAGDDVVMFPDGRFTFRDVPPGRYVVRGHGAVGGSSDAVFATYAVAVEGKNVENVSLQLSPAATIEGTVEWQPVTGARRFQARSALRVRVPFEDGSSFADTLTGSVDDAGRFQIRGVIPGAHLLTIEGLTEPWIIERVMVKGRNVAGISFDISPGDYFRDVRIIVSDTAARVSGLVRDRTGAPAAGAVVLLSNEAAELWTSVGRRVRVLRAGLDGRYEIRGLAPGGYRLIAVAGLDEGETLHRDALEKVFPVAAPLTLQPRAARTLDLPLVYAPGPAGFTR